MRAIRSPVEYEPEWERFRAEKTGARIIRLAGAGATPGWQTMVETESGEAAYWSQWSHPHPSFSPDGRWPAYSSDATGRPQALVVEVSEAS